MSAHDWRCVRGAGQPLLALTSHPMVEHGCLMKSGLDDSWSSPQRLRDYCGDSDARSESPGSALRDAAGLAGLLWVPPTPNISSWHSPFLSHRSQDCCAALSSQDQSVIMRPKVRPVCLELSGEQSPK